MSMPALPPTGRIILRMSPENLIDGFARSVILWDPTKCAKSCVARMTQILSSSTRYGDLDFRGHAALQYITGGPRAVEFWSQLEDKFKEHTREALGLIDIDFELAAVWCVDSNDSDDYASYPSGSDSSEDEEAPPPNGRDPPSEAVSYGPIDAWIEKKADTKAEK